MDNPSKSTPELLRVIHDYHSEDKEHLCLSIGDIIVVEQKDDSGWYQGTTGVKRGWFPSTFTKNISRYMDKAKTKNFEVVLSVPELQQNGTCNYFGISTSKMILSTFPMGDLNDSDCWILALRKSIELFSPLLHMDNRLKFNGTTREALAFMESVSRSKVILNKSKDHKDLMETRIAFSRVSEKWMLHSLLASAKWTGESQTKLMKHHAGESLLAFKDFILTAKRYNIQWTSSDLALDKNTLREINCDEADLPTALMGLVHEASSELAKLANISNYDHSRSKIMIEHLNKAISAIIALLGVLADLNIFERGAQRGLQRLWDTYRQDILHESFRMIQFIKECRDPTQCSLVAAQNSKSIMNVIKGLSDQLVIAFELQESFPFSWPPPSPSSLEMDELKAQLDAFNEKFGYVPATVVEESNPPPNTPGSISSPLTPPPQSNSVSSILEVDSLDTALTAVHKEMHMRPLQLSQPRFSSMRLSASDINISGDLDLNKPPSTKASSDKLQKILGAEAAKSISDIRSKPESQRKHWFLEYDYPATDLTYNMEGQIQGATITALIERLTIHDKNIDEELFASFFLTYRMFSSTKEVLELLRGRYKIKPPPNFTKEDYSIWKNEKKIPIEQRVIIVLKNWLEQHWDPELDADCEQLLLEFIISVVKVNYPRKADKLLEIADRKKALKIYKIRADSKPLPLPESVQQWDGPNMLEVDYRQFSAQLTAADHHVFCRIRPNELLGLAWQKENSISVNVKKMTAFSTRLTEWCMQTILSESDAKKRAQIIKNLIKVSSSLLDLQNYNSLIAILSGLDSSAIRRLKITWEIIPNKYKQVLEKLRKSVDHSKNYTEYRESLKQASLPCLPFLGLYLKDLVFTHDGNTDTKNDGQLINFSKYLKISSTLAEIKKFQYPYQLEENPQWQHWLRAHLVESKKKEVDYYEISLKLEPRQSDN